MNCMSSCMSKPVAACMSKLVACMSKLVACTSKLVASMSRSSCFMLGSSYFMSESSYFLLNFMASMFKLSVFVAIQASAVVSLLVLDRHP